MRIFVTGLTSTAIGGMEYHNLGNYIIVEPLFEKLRETFPDADITTSLQMSEAFYNAYGLRARREERFWRYGYKTAKETISDAVRVICWKAFRLRRLLQSPLLSELSAADLVIDFSGDIYGDNAKWNKFLETNARLILALALRKPVAMVVGSPGPFRALWRQWLARRVLSRLKLVTNREPLSTAMLAYIGIKGEGIRSTACPSVFFRAAPIEQFPRNEDYRKLVEERQPTIGLIVSGWNMPVGPYNKPERRDSEFEKFIDLIRFIRKQTSYRVCLMAHQNSTDSDGKLVKGTDHKLIDRIKYLLDTDYDDNRVFALSHLYDAAMSKTIIGQLDLLVSGRIHGAVQALSQGIPTVILDYGHEPRPHKLWGFALLYGVGDYMASPGDAKGMQAAVTRLVENREKVEQQLRTRVPEVQRLAQTNFEMLVNLK